MSISLISLNILSRSITISLQKRQEKSVRKKKKSRKKKANQKKMKKKSARERKGKKSSKKKERKGMEREIDVKNKEAIMSGSRLLEKKV